VLAALLTSLLYPALPEKEGVFEIYSEDQLEFASRGRAVLLVFSSDSCPDCIRLSRKYSEIRQLLPEGVLLAEVPYKPGVTDSLFEMYGVTVTPTLFVMRDGKVVARREGLATENPADIAEWVSSSLGGSTNQESGRAPLSTSLGLFALPALGFLAAFSPCSLPFVIAVGGAVASELSSAGSSKRALYPLLAFSAGAFASLLLLALSFSALMLVVHRIEVFTAVLMIMVGTLSLSSSGLYPSFSKIPRGRGAYAVYALSGMIAIQCSAPLFVGSAALLSAGFLKFGVLRPALALLGMWAAYLVASLLASVLFKGASLLVKNARLVDALAAVAFFAAGILFLAW